MSYILDALKKSDQQRQRGATPTLPTAQAPAPAPQRSLAGYYGLLAAAMLGVGVTIGWLRPWQAEQPLPAAESARAPIPAPQRVSPLPEAPETTDAATETPVTTEMPATVAGTEREWPAAAPASVAQAAAGGEGAKPDAPAVAPGAIPSAPPAPPEKPARVAQEQQKAIPWTELPHAIQQGIPEMTIQLHAYSGNPAERLVSVNSRMLREGGELAPGIRLEQITPDGMIFSYKGYRFQRGIR